MYRLDIGDEKGKEYKKNIIKCVKYLFYFIDYKKVINMIK